MSCLFMKSLFLPYFFGLIFSALPSCHGDMIDTKVLNVGMELWKETLPLKMGSCLYQLQGLKSHTWYEVKISYPASIPASFSIQLRRSSSDFVLNRNRRLLDTEKLIFKTDDLDSLRSQDGMYVLITVEPAGVVAIPHTRERELIIFNIVCDELLLGIPHKAWGVGFLILLCLALALVVPNFLPPSLLQKNRSPESANQVLLKDS